MEYCVNTMVDCNAAAAVKRAGASTVRAGDFQAMNGAA